MRIVVVNPNSTESMTALIGASARAVAGRGTRIDAVTSPTGPPAIESRADEINAVPGLLSVLSSSPADGYVLACFGDPGLGEARELVAGPVVGIAEAGMRAATHLGRSFAVVTTVVAAVDRTLELVDEYGLREHCRSVRACEVPVLALETDPHARELIVEQGRLAVERDGAEVLVLGCAGMADLPKELSAELGVPVVDGVAAAVTTVEGLVRTGLSTSRAGAYARC